MARLSFSSACAVLTAALVASSAASADETTPPGQARARAKRHRVARVVEAHGRALHAGAKDAKHAPQEHAESIGSPNDGHLRGGVHLDLSHPYLHVVPAYESGDMRWGLPALVNMIDRAARDVQRRYPGAVLNVGDLSQRGGGDIRHHHSHESGRDADLGFYVMDSKGKQIHARGFIKFDPSMASPTVPGARFDLPRNWALVQDLLTDPGARVTHLFIAEWIRHELLAYARPRVSHALWERAALALMQPHNSLPHDDHVHVRISCPRDNHGTCVEIARPIHPVQPGRPHVAHRSDPGGHTIHTPAHAASHATPVAPPLSLPASDDPLPDLDILDD